MSSSVNLTIHISSYYNNKYGNDNDGYIPLIHHTQPCVLLSSMKLMVDEETSIKWGELIESILKTCKFDEMRKSILSMRWTHKYSFWNSNILGLHISPYDKVELKSSLMIDKNEYRIEIELKNDWYYPLEDAFTFWKEKKPWPPADNYWENDPISMLKIHRYDDNSSCAECESNFGHYDAIKDNGKENMVVLVYPSSFRDSEIKEAKRVAFNKHGLLKYLKTMTKPVDPIARIPISIENIRLIENGKNFDPVFL